MYGYPNRTCSVAEGTHDPLHAKVLVLAAGKERMAIVTIDIGTFGSAALQKRVADELGIPVLLVSSSTPTRARSSRAGPAGDSRDGRAAAIRADLEAMIFDAVKRASQSLFPARLGVGRGSLQLGYNRLCCAIPAAPRRSFQSGARALRPGRSEFVVLRVEDDAGRVRAVMVHYACHAVVMQGWNCMYSADWPGVMQSKVEAALAGSQCMFVQGGAGEHQSMMMGMAKNRQEDFRVWRRWAT